MIKASLALGILALGLSACENEPTLADVRDGAISDAGGETSSAPEPDEAVPKRTDNSIECALFGSAGFVRTCTIERTKRDGKDLLILRHPDGGFRRFELGVPGKGLVAADGMEEVAVKQLEGMVELTIGPDRYRVPVTP